MVSAAKYTDLGLSFSPISPAWPIGPHSKAKHILETMSCEIQVASSPGSPIFQRCMRKEGEPDKTYHERDIRWNQLPYMVQQRVGWLERRISHRKFEFFDLNVTISYESASGGPVKNCDLHGNSIVSTSKSVPPGRRHDRVTVQIAVFEELELLVRNASLEPAN